ncbi:MAG: sugar transferase [Alphaproteobacteria bacterium]|nr:sugar transferase [Alphaproteobacteria bacterium]
MILRLFYQAVKSSYFEDFAVAKKFPFLGSAPRNAVYSRSRQPSRGARGSLKLVRRSASRITDPRLVVIVKRANGPFKRGIDIVSSLAGLVFLAPLYLTIAIAIMIFDPGPVLFGHERVGRQGRTFKCWKFRSMVLDSKQRLQSLLASDPAAAQEWAATQKLSNDPRITPLGRFLRKTSLDELPQFWNVLCGDMSLVGPRPITREELDRYGRDRRYYLVVRPGISGLWQISGRSQSSYEERVALDRRYVETWSFWRDLKIVAMTIPAVLMSRGAL